MLNGTFSLTTYCSLHRRSLSTSFWCSSFLFVLAPCDLAMTVSFCVSSQFLFRDLAKGTRLLSALLIPYGHCHFP